MKRYNAAPWAAAQAAPSTMPETGEMETAVPARAADFVADLVVPLAQAAVTGALVGGLLTFGLAEVLPDLDLDLVKVWGLSALGISTVAWLVLLGQTRRLLWAVETWIGRDLDGDQVTGPPSERVVIVNAGQARQEAAQRAGTERASEFGRFVAALPVRGTSQRAWESELGRDTYAEYRDALIRLGWARWKSVKQDGTPNETKGWELTLDAADILRRISG